MSSAAPQADLDRKYSFEEWYDLIQTSETKYEFVDGWLVDVRSMAGATLNHSRIAVNLIVRLSGALTGKPCDVLNSDMAVRARSEARCRYPDASVVCAAPEFDEDDKKQLVLLNPKVVIEVFSSTTAGIDRGDKFSDYRAIATLQQYVLISSSEAMIEAYTRRDDGTWLFQYWTGREAAAHLAAIDVTIPLSDLYAGVTFDADGGKAPPPASTAPTPT